MTMVRMSKKQGCDSDQDGARPPGDPAWQTADKLPHSRQTVRDGGRVKTSAFRMTFPPERAGASDQPRPHPKSRDLRPHGGR